MQSGWSNQISKSSQRRSQSQRIETRRVVASHRFSSGSIVEFDQVTVRLEAWRKGRGAGDRYPDDDQDDDQSTSTASDHHKLPPFWCRQPHAQSGRRPPRFPQENWHRSTHRAKGVARQDQQRAKQDTDNTVLWQRASQFKAPQRQGLQCQTQGPHQDHGRYYYSSARDRLAPAWPTTQEWSTAWRLVIVIGVQGYSR